MTPRPSPRRSRREAAKPAKDAAAPPAAKPKRELSPALAALRDLVRQTLAMHQKQAFNTRENSATEIMNYCLAFGCGTEVSLDGSDGQRINGITCLCWNYPCGGFEMLGPSQGHIAARIGYGYQEHPGEFLAMLAMSRVPPNYPVRVGKDTRTVADLVEAEKLACRSGSDLSLKLIGLSYYVDEPEWKNDLGETWSIERIIQEEIAQPVVTAPEGGLNRLMGLSYAVARRAKRGQPIDGQFERAQKYIGRLPGRSPCNCKTPTAVGGRTSWPPGAPAPTPPSSCDPPAACWSGWPSRCPTRSSKTPAWSRRSSTSPACWAASGTSGTRRRFPRGRLPRWDTPCTP